MELLTLFSENSDVTLYALFGALSIFTFVVAFLAVLPKSSWRNGSVALFFLICLGMGYVSLGELLSRPKPVGIMTWEKPDVEKATVMSSFVVEGEAIYMLLMYEGIAVPRYYQFPWNKNLAEELQRGKRAQEMGEIQGMELELPFEKSFEDRDTFIYELPWPKPPQKKDDREVIDLNEKMV